MDEPAPGPIVVDTAEFNRPADPPGAVDPLAVRLVLFHPPGYATGRTALITGVFEGYYSLVWFADPKQDMSEPVRAEKGVPWWDPAYGEAQPPRAHRYACPLTVTEWPR